MYLPWKNVSLWLDNLCHTSLNLNIAPMNHCRIHSYWICRNEKWHSFMLHKIIMGIFSWQIHCLENIHSHLCCILIFISFFLHLSFSHFFFHQILKFHLVIYLPWSLTRWKWHHQYGVSIKNQTSQNNVGICIHSIELIEINLKCRWWWLWLWLWSSWNRTWKYQVGTIISGNSFC